MSAIKQRHGFAMIMAIFVLLLVAAGGALIMRNAATGSKTVGDNYLRAQAELLAESATEYALMQAQGNADGCYDQPNITVNDAGGSHMFTIDVDMAYSFNIPYTGGGCSGGATMLAQNTGKDSMVLIDVRVTTAAGLNTEPVTAVRRTWQKL